MCVVRGCVCVCVCVCVSVCVCVGERRKIELTAGREKSAHSPDAIRTCTSGIRAHRASDYTTRAGTSCVSRNKHFRHSPASSIMKHKHALRNTPTPICGLWKWQRSEAIIEIVDGLRGAGWHREHRSGMVVKRWGFCEIDELHIYHRPKRGIMTAALIEVSADRCENGVREVVCAAFAWSQIYSPILATNRCIRLVIDVWSSSRQKKKGGSWSPEKLRMLFFFFFSNQLPSSSAPFHTHSQSRYE